MSELISAFDAFDEIARAIGWYESEGYFPEPTYSKLRAEYDTARASFVARLRALESTGEASDQAIIPPSPMPTYSPRVIGDETFAAVWSDRDFKSIMPKAFTLPHRESGEAIKTVRGWLDGKDNDTSSLRAEVDRVIAHKAEFLPHGFNPVQSYVMAFYAARTRQPREIRALPYGDVIGVEQALVELTASPDQGETGQAAAGGVRPQKNGKT